MQVHRGPITIAVGDRFDARCRTCHEGETILGSLKDGQRVIIEDGVAKLPTGRHLPAASATADRVGPRRSFHWPGCSLRDAVKYDDAETPARDY